ncbi:Fimbrial protein [Dyella sp. AD56]|nr:Fimbrial protein [Dyella sp. AD56]
MTKQARVRTRMRGQGTVMTSRDVSLWRHAGFTLIEVMIVMAIIAILAAVAFPSYLKHVTKANRVAAEGCLSQLSSYMERYNATYLRYDKTGSDKSATDVALPSLDCSSSQQTGRFYKYAFDSTPTQTTYKINAAPQDAQKTRDGMCGTLSLDQAGNRTTSTGQTSDCW